MSKINKVVVSIAGLGGTETTESLYEHLTDVHKRNPYLFLEQQLVDCTAPNKEECPTCKAAIEERIEAGLITRKRVNEIIAKHKENK
mgnify:CR=1 FL=1